MIANALTIDVEDYFQVSSFAPYISRSEWGLRECRIERNIEQILNLLDNNKTKATFFSLGWIAKRYPNLIREIAAQGHEIASHGFNHERVTDLSQSEFYSDILSAKKILEDLSGAQVKGYRAPSFSINETNQWAFECLSRAGYVYSSSVYPISHDHYGMPSSPRFIHKVKSGLIEIPVSTINMMGRNYPASGGGYFRLLPYAFSRWMFEHVNNVEKQPLIFYFHPWEIDPEQPKIKGIDIKTKFRHYLNLRIMEERLNKLIKDFHWDRMDNIFLRSPFFQ